MVGGEASVRLCEMEIENENLLLVHKNLFFRVLLLI